MPEENTVMEKNSRTHTAHSDKNAVFTLLAIWRTVNRFSLRRYTPRSRVSTAMAKPASDQKNRSDPTSMPMVARINSGWSSITRPFSMSCS